MFKTFTGNHMAEDPPSNLACDGPMFIPSLVSYLEIFTCFHQCSGFNPNDTARGRSPLGFLKSQFVHHDLKMIAVLHLLFINVYHISLIIVLITYHGYHHGSHQILCCDLPPSPPEVRSADAAEIARWIGDLRSLQLAPDGVTFTTVLQATRWLRIGRLDTA